MTPANLAIIHNRCEKAWRRTEAGTRPECGFDDFYHAVVVRVLIATKAARDAGKPPPWGDKFGAFVWQECRTYMRSLVRDEIKQRETIAVMTFDVRVAKGGLPAEFEVPFRTWGGGRTNSGGARPNSGGRRPGAGRPRKCAA